MKALEVSSLPAEAVEEARDLVVFDGVTVSSISADRLRSMSSEGRDEPPGRVKTFAVRFLMILPQRRSGCSPRRYMVLTACSAMPNLHTSRVSVFIAYSSYSLAKAPEELTIEEIEEQVRLYLEV